MPFNCTLTNSQPYTGTRIIFRVIETLKGTADEEERGEEPPREREMKGHISDIRLMELALDTALVPQNGEARHLGVCESCSKRLEEEKALTSAILASPGLSAPHGFTESTVALYRLQTRKRTTRQVGAALAILTTLFAPVIALVASGWADVLGSLGSLTAELAAMWSAAVTIASSAPLVTLAVVAALCLTGLTGCLLLASLTRSAESVKYPLHRNVPPGGEA